MSSLTAGVLIGIPVAVGVALVAIRIAGHVQVAPLGAGAPSGQSRSRRSRIGLRLGGWLLFVTGVLITALAGIDMMMFWGYSDAVESVGEAIERVLVMAFMAGVPFLLGVAMLVDGSALSRRAGRVLLISFVTLWLLACVIATVFGSSQ